MKEKRMKREIEMKRGERRDDFVGKCLKTKKTPDELAQACFEKQAPSDEFFFPKFRILPVFSIIYMIQTCGRGAGAHRDVLIVHTEAFLNLHTEGLSVPHHTHHNHDTQQRTEHAA